MLALATVGFAVNFWAWALLSPLGPRFKDVLALSGSQQALLVAVPVIVGSLGRIPVGALTDRFGGRVMFPAGLRGDHRPGPVPRPGGAAVPRRPARGRLLPGHRRHRLRGRRAVRQRVVPARAAGPRDRHLRRRHGWHRDQRADHGQARHGRRRGHPLPHHGCGAGALRRRRRLRAARRPGPRRAHRVAGTAPRRSSPAADHLAGLPAVRRGLRRLRRLLGLPAGLPQDRLRPRAGRRRQPDGRLRRARRADAAGRRLAVRPRWARAGARRRPSPS